MFCSNKMITFAKPNNLKKNLYMGVLKLHILDEQVKEEKNRVKKLIKTDKPNHIGACDCPCWAFIRKGESVVCEDIASTASWNID